MRKLILFSLILFTLWPHYGFAQSSFSNSTPIGELFRTVEEAKTAIQDNYMFMWYRHPEDTITNINRFIENINKVVPVNEEKRNRLKILILSETRQPRNEKPPYRNWLEVGDVISLNWHHMTDFVPFLGINADQIIRENFSLSDYEEIYEKLRQDRIRAENALYFLRWLHDDGRDMDDWIGFIAGIESFHFILDYFGFDGALERLNIARRQFTKETAMAIIRESYMLMWFRHAEDTVANINRFLENVNRAVPFDEQKSNKMSAQILTKIQQTESSRSLLPDNLLGVSWSKRPDSLSDSLTIVSWDRRINSIPLMGVNVGEVIRENFSYQDHIKIFNKLTDIGAKAMNAYYFLLQEYNIGKKQDELIWGRASDLASDFHFILDYFGFDGFSPERFEQSVETRRPFTQETAMTAIQNNYMFMWFRNPEDTAANVNRLIENINRVIPLNKEKSDTIKLQILSKIRQPEREGQILTPGGTFTFAMYRTPNFVPLMGINVDWIIQESFSPSDYKYIYDRLVEDRLRARNAFRFLRITYNEGREREKWIWGNGDNPMEIFHFILDYFEF